MPETRRRPLWAGRALALAAILLLALNLRSAVAALSPVVGFIVEDVPLDAIAIGVLGMMAPVAFALCGPFAPALTNRFGLEVSLLGACAAMIAGPLLRASATSSAMLFAGTAVTFVGMGIGNVLLPPAVKRYFPDRIGVVTSAYATLLALSTALPPAVAVPVAEAAGWRASLAVWGLLALSALVPWMILWLRGRRARAGGHASGTLPGDRRLARGLWRSRTAWAMALVFGASAINVYAAFAWLPQLLTDHVGRGPGEAGALLATFAFVGLPLSVLVPVLAARMGDIAPLIHGISVCMLAGYLGLLLAPTAATVLWVSLAGVGGALFPIALVLINLRTRTPSGSVALSGFVQGIGYTAGALGPLVVGLLHATTGSWTGPLVFLLLAGVLPMIAGVVLRKPVYVDEPRG